MYQDMSSMTPITILTGYLGVGKTTLLQRILHTKHGIRVAVVVNDFGAVNIDTRLVVGSEDELVTLANGCICCTNHGDLVTTVYNLLHHNPTLQHVIIEASGVADPIQMVLNFNRSGLRSKVQIDSIMAVVDAEQISHIKGKVENLIREQIRVADVVIINKTDLITKNALESVRRWIRAVTEQARILEAEYGDVPMNLILGAGSYDPQRAFDKSGHGVHVYTAEEMNDHQHHDLSLVFGTLTWRCDDPLSVTKVRAVLENLPSSVFRAKGIVYARQFPDKQLILQMVGPRVSLIKGDPWGARTPTTEIALIGEKTELENQAVLLERFETTRATDTPTSELSSFVDGALRWLRIK